MAFCVRPGPWSIMDGARPDAFNAFELGPNGYIAMGPTPIFNFNPEQTGSIDTSLTGYSFTRATTATTISRVGSLYTIESVATGTPRYVDHPTLGAGYWCESSATNICLQSEDPETTWAQLDAGDTFGGSTTAPDGTTITNGLIGDTTDGIHGITQEIANSASNTYTFSVWAKAGDQDYIAFQFHDGSTKTAYFNVASGTLGAGGAGIVDHRISSYGNGWYRCEMTTVGDNVEETWTVYSAPADSDVTFAGDGSTVNTYLWGMQLEVNPVASSYIPTTTTSVTRNGDELLYGPALSSLPDGGSLLIDLTTNAYNPGVNKWLAQVGTADRIYIASSSSDQARLQVWDGTKQADITGTTDIFDSTRRTVAGSWALNDVSLNVAGSSEGTPDSSATVPSPNDNVFVGWVTGGNQINGVIHSVKVYDVTGVTE